jgi:hypothetical protein
LCSDARKIETKRTNPKETAYASPSLAHRSKETKEKNGNEREKEARTGTTDENEERKEVRKEGRKEGGGGRDRPSIRRRASRDEEGANGLLSSAWAKTSSWSRRDGGDDGEKAEEQEVAF